ncbi:MAG: (Fe-S)-binding protein [Candidatus Marinimicrobia bacterium]|nr:(Fe-S)-binding protein [Candidatus Neomarinimicrobiota bacterium]
MLTQTEQIAFILLTVVSIAFAWRGFSRLFKIVKSGADTDRSDGLSVRFIKALFEVGIQKPVFKARRWVSVFHSFIFFGFSFYLLVNVNDILEAYVDGWHLIGAGTLAGVFNLFADIFSIFVIVGMNFFLYRRFVTKPKELGYNDNVMLHPGVDSGGIKRDSLLVGVFILLHVGSRWLGTVFHIAELGHGDPWLPIANLFAPLFSFMSHESLEIAIHITWWLAMGLIVIFIPYFPRSKHLHLMVAPVNLALGRKTPPGRMDDVLNISSPGAASLTDLPWPQVLDAYACIMCNRCQEVCPAHTSGTPLSPAALEINKRYFINEKGDEVLNGAGAQSLIDYAISDEAVWACTTCYACVQVCPVGNEPLMDILELRRNMVFDGRMPDELADVLRSLDEQGNSFRESARRRTRWTKDLDFEIKDAKSEPVKYLWYVGDFASYNQSCRDVSRKLARILHSAGVDFGIIMKGEKSAGNDVRRVGEEGLFEALAEENIETLAQCDYEEIFTTDPHTYNALHNEYGKFGAEYKIKHYSTLLNELIESGMIEIKKKIDAKATYHDPCYLGRYNGNYEAPRDLMKSCGVELVEMPRNRENSFCCGAGGGRIWMKDHDDMTQRPSENRIEEAMALGGIEYFTVSCPKDFTMYSDAVKTSGNEGKIEVRDIVDYLMEAMDLHEESAAKEPLITE